eukprot:5652696-Amphidinium_carterae.2
MLWFVTWSDSLLASSRLDSTGYWMFYAHPGVLEPAGPLYVDTLSDVVTATTAGSTPTKSTSTSQTDQTLNSALRRLSHIVEQPFYPDGASKNGLNCRERKSQRKNRVYDDWLCYLVESVWTCLE